MARMVQQEIRDLQVQLASEVIRDLLETGVKQASAAKLVLRASKACRDRRASAGKQASAASKARKASAVNGMVSPRHVSATFSLAKTRLHRVATTSL